MKKKASGKKPKEKVSAKAKKPAGKAAPAKKPAKKLTKTPIKTVKNVVAEIVDDDSVAPDIASEIHPDIEPEKAYAVPSDADIEEELGIDDTPSKGLVTKDTSRAITTADPLAIYLSDIRKYPVLSKEEEQEIAKKYFETKDPEAAQILVKSNLRFVVKIAAEYSKFGAKMIDLVQEGNVGLMHAVRDFNPYKGARLITYAVWWIRGYIQEYLMRQYSMVRIGTTQNQRKLFYKLQKEKDALDALGQEPNIALISSRLGIPEDEVEQMAQRMSGRDVSLDRPLDDDSGTSLLDLQKSTSDMSLEDRLAHEEQLEILKEKLKEMRSELSDREKIILDERLLNDEPLTLQEIGEKYGITREAVRQMEVRVLKKIKAKMEEEEEK
ncbi:RNA polymerase sigma factor RpoD/SigA [Bdellovibrio sp. HCB337]|uniref:sigma-70 family RNA polymerase sigma factor n=1 Tax=Bdellovibrio sp. HCB337 TaxID=3394358 RepID=UPI0039A642BF